jgi:hypothetical protein
MHLVVSVDSEALPSGANTPTTRNRTPAIVT